MLNSQPANDLEHLQQILKAYFVGLPVEVYLFGSAARGTLRRGSDLDVGVLPLAPLPPALLSNLREHLENSNLLHPVEIVDLSQATSDFVERVKTEGQQWIG